MQFNLCNLGWDGKEDKTPITAVICDEEKDESFFRNNFACYVKNIRGIWWGYVGIEKNHPLYGSRFYKSPTNGAIYSIPVSFESETLNKKWWMGFEGGYSKIRTLNKIINIIDSITFDPSFKK